MKESLITLSTTIYYKSAKGVFICATYLSPVNFIFFLVGISIMLDTVFGRWCAKRLAKRAGKDVRLEVTSKKTREGLLGKMITYNIAIITVFIIDNHVLDPLVNYYFESFPIRHIVTKLVGVVMVLIEMDSIDEKYYLVTGKRMSAKFQVMLQKLKRIIQDVFQFKKKLQE